MNISLFIYLLLFQRHRLDPKIGGKKTRNELQKKVIETKERKRKNEMKKKMPKMTWSCANQQQRKKNKREKGTMEESIKNKRKKKKKKVR